MGILQKVQPLLRRVVAHVALRDPVIMGVRLGFVVPCRLFPPKHLQTAKLSRVIAPLFLDKRSSVGFRIHLTDLERLLLLYCHDRRLSLSLTVKRVSNQQSGYYKDTGNKLYA